MNEAEMKERTKKPLQCESSSWQMPFQERAAETQSQIKLFEAEVP
jgi:hypothetical protein